MFHKVQQLGQVGSPVSSFDLASFLLHAGEINIQGQIYGAGPGPQASHHQRVSHQTVSIYFSLMIDAYEITTQLSRIVDHCRSVAITRLV